MITATTTKALADALAPARDGKQSIGLVPTMGALHDGHLSLISRAVKENDTVVVSIFVNPIQFNNQEDLQKYPRTLDDDLNKIEQLADGSGRKVIAFAPSVEEMYPEPVTTTYHFGPIEEVMEGPRRPGHFSGVAVVVKRLFDLVQPQRAYFGEKDFQQIAIIRELLRQTQLPITLVPCPIVRADDGLALSSRNMRLSPAARNMAPAIYATLCQAVEMSYCEELPDVKDWVADTLDTFHEVNPQPDGLQFEVEYFEIVNDTTLQPIDTWDDAPGIVGCIAVWLDGVRLIDVIRFRPEA
ncbi:MAG: pantoate--beta-alanine ligase [Bacteroidales bacterium]|nr:pantoate--beta-alanine ligase [Bacteroidales bacterium]